MKPFMVKFHLYAENDKEIQDLQSALYDFVTSLYKEQIYLSASKVMQLIHQFKSNPFVKQYLK